MFSFYRIDNEAPGGTYQLIGQNITCTSQVISRTRIPHLSLILSNDPDSTDQGIAELIIGKHRNGSTGVVRTAFIPAHMDFSDSPINNSQPSITHGL